jgi:hypothetical protein
MDALKDIPDNVDRLETLTGTVRHQKTDIFKKLMWFSYPNDENWIALDLARVKEVQKLNKEGIKPEFLKELVPEEDKPVLAKVFDYENVVGQDSLTRLDNKSVRNKKNNRKKGNKPKGPGSLQPQAEAGAAKGPLRQEVRPPAQANMPAEPSAERPAGTSRNNKRRKNNRNNNNRERPAE